MANANRRRGSVKPAKTVPDVDPSTGLQRVDPSGRPKAKPAPGTTWYYVVDVGEGGERDQQRERGFRTRGDAQAALNAVLQRHAEKRHVDYSAMTYGAYLAKVWLPAIRDEEITITTWTRYAADVRLHLLPHPVADMKLQKVSGKDLDKLWADLRRKPKQKGGGVLSRRSVHLVSTTVSRSFKDAVSSLEMRYDNPCTRSKMPTQGRAHEAKSWDAETLNAFLIWDETFDPNARAKSAVTLRPGDPRCDRLYALWRVVGYTGMRRGETLALSWDDVHLDPTDRTACRCRPEPTGPHLKISWAIRTLESKDLDELHAEGVDLGEITAEDIKRGWMWGAPKTDAGHRSVSIDEGTADALREWRSRQAKERLALGAGWAGVVGPLDEDGKKQGQRNLVFCGPDGAVLLPKAITAIFLRRTERFGNRLSIHGLRHTWATLALEAGVHLVIVQKRLGHADPATTAKIYSHVRPAVDAEAAATVADRIANAPLPGSRPKRTTRRRKAAGDVTPIRRRP